ncbi:hypothetical protein SAMN02910369_02718 [Lachnospiraceae bacterium NE2001]|nr:hypothetical protein SAMN02910369_02718 [Lachnospiraceae bacterium NE2001]
MKIRVERLILDDFILDMTNVRVVLNIGKDSIEVMGKINLNKMEEKRFSYKTTVLCDLYDKGNGIMMSQRYLITSRLDKSYKDTFDIDFMNVSQRIDIQDINLMVLSIIVG